MAAVLLFNACASSGRFTQTMNSWLGEDINSAIMRFGPPSNTYRLPNGTTMYTWLWVGNTVVNQNYNQYLNMVTTNARTRWCQLSFTASAKNLVEGWTANGNMC